MGFNAADFDGADGEPDPQRFRAARARPRRGQEADLMRSIDRADERRFAMEEAAIGRQRQMVEEMATMRQLAERGEKRERSADDRAEVAEARAHKMLKLTVASVTIGGVGVAAAIMAIFTG